MIDTIVLMLKQEQFVIMEHDKFSPSSVNLFRNPYYRMGKKGYFQCFQNPEKSDYEKGNYKPRLTLTKRLNKSEFSTTLRIEFSVPKLLYGNNFVEVMDEDFGSVIKKLRIKLGEMGVLVSEDNLSTADVASVHYSKNIILEKYLTAKMILNELSKINLTKRLDLSSTDFRNNGHALRFHSNSYEIIFYDKLKDMQQSTISEKRAIEFDCCMQRNFYNEFLRSTKKEVIRMEVRLNSRRKITDIMNKIEHKGKLTFSDVMKYRISKNVLCYYWNKVIEDMLLFSFDDSQPENLFNDIALNNNLNLNMTLKFLGALMLINSTGIRGFRSLSETYSSVRNSQRFIREVKKLKLKKDVKYRAISSLDKTLNEFEAVCLHDYVTNY